MTYYGKRYYDDADTGIDVPTSPQESVAAGIAALEEVESRALRTYRDNRWEKDYGWVVGWEERIDIERIDMNDPQKDIRAQMFGVGWRESLWNVRQAQRFQNFAKSLGMSVPTDQWDGHDWTADEAARRGYPAGMPEERALGGNRVPSSILEEEYRKAAEELTQVWKEALSARKQQRA